MFRVITGLMVILFTIFLVSCDFLEDETELGENEVRVLSSESSFIGKNYHNVVNTLEGWGFINITTIPVYDIIFNITPRESTNDVKIDGRDNYKNGDIFFNYVEVIVTYSMRDEDEPVEPLGENEVRVESSESSFIGSHYEAVVSTLQEWGFTNIETQAVYDIVWGFTSEGTTKSVTINESNTFKNGDIFNKDVLIVITYSMKESNDPTKQKYKVTWQYDDGTIIKIDEVLWGNIPNYTGTAPTKESTNDTRYIFDGWSPEVVQVTGEQIYVALFIEEENVFTITWKNHDGTVLEVDQNVKYGVTPTYDGVVPIKSEDEEYTYVFDEWNPEVYSVTKNQVYVAQFNRIPKTVTVIIQSWDETEILNQEYDYGHTISEQPVPERLGYTFAGWIANDEKVVFPLTVTKNITIYALWIVDFEMVQVGESSITYTVPTGIDDDGTAALPGGYFMATTLTTYELWYQVRIWAEANGYHFQNVGREGHDGIIGAVPTANKLEPATTMNWRDVIVWTNALSEMLGLEPVYRTSTGIIIRDSRDTNASQVDLAIQNNKNGYRLPTANEWEMAARWKNDSETTNGSILVGGRYWTPGNYASGATADYYHEGETRAVAWYSYGVGNSQNYTRPVGMLLPNHLGIYDMSGNVREWTYTSTVDSGRILKGGSYFFLASVMQVGENGVAGVTSGGSITGFRLVRGA